MEALSVGFCVAAVTLSQAPKEVAAWQAQWPQPTVQVVDIQRYPRVPTTVSGPSRFYVAVSDSESLAWLVVPPRTPLEDAIAAFAIEVGCCMTLLSHALVTAANGLNVVVPLQVQYTHSTARLLGQPRITESLFPLSAQSLLRRCTDDEEDAAAAAAVDLQQRPSHPIALRDFTEAPQRALGNWCVTARVVWKGRAYALNAQGGRFDTGGVNLRGSCGGYGTSTRFVFRCLLADERGDAMVAAFFGVEALGERVLLHGCYRLAHGTVKWGTGESGAPVELQFTEKSIEAELPRGPASSPFPLYPSALVGEAAAQVRRVGSIVEAAQFGDYVSVVGVVVAVQPKTLIHARQSRVWRTVVTLGDQDEDHATAHVARGSGPYIEVTLWDDAGDLVEPALGEPWLFHQCAVQLFQQRKTLSSRRSTMAVQLVPRPRAASPTEHNGDPEPEASAGAPATHAPTPAAAAPAKAMQLVLELHESSPTLPVLARVQAVEQPLLLWTCAVCQRDGEAQPAVCGRCGAADAYPTLRVRVWLSDGLCVRLAVAHRSVAEALLGLSSVMLARQLEREPRAAATALCESLVGTPVLVWLLAGVDDDVAGTPRFMIAGCQHVDYVPGCHTLLSVMDALASETAADENARTERGGADRE